VGQVGFKKKTSIGNMPRSRFGDCSLETGEIRDNAAMTASPTTEEMVEGGLRSSLLGIVINLSLALVKCLTGLIGHSFALLADGIESFLDVISSSVVYYGLRLAIKPPDKDHPYGHGKADPIAAAVVGVAMIAAAFGIAAESINLIRTPHKLLTRFGS
jgi:divalent metal cation (Fe/Co/Zn/Cd) transporter